MVINRAFELAPWADALYAADGQFWQHYPAAREFSGLKITADRNTALQWKLRLIRVEGSHQFKMTPLGTVAHGGNSAHQGINLEFQFGARRLLLIGFDLCGEHFHEAHKPPLRNPRPQTLEKWRKRLDAQAPTLAALGVTVINCSMRSALTAFPKMPVAEALAAVERRLGKREAA